jgi:hypothetical protein
MSLAEKVQTLVEYSMILTDEQKAAWLNLIPKMVDSELQQLYGILTDEVADLKKQNIDLIEDHKLEAEVMADVKAPMEQKQESHGASLESLKKVAQPVGATMQASANQFGKELGREVATKEIGTEIVGVLPAPTAAATPKPMPHTIAPPSKPTPRVVPPRSVAVPSDLKAADPDSVPLLKSFKSIKDLATIEVAHLRQGKVSDQIRLILELIMKLSKAGKTMPYFGVQEFEKSPLFKTYLMIGAALIGDNTPDRRLAFEKAMRKASAAGSDIMSQQEFEAVADLRKQIEQF